MYKHLFTDREIYAAVFCVIAIFSLSACSKKNIMSWMGAIPVEPNYSPASQVCLWKYNKKAAYTIGFDDARESHYAIAGPELFKRNMVGTFYIQTRALNKHTANSWRILILLGHEIGSHTRSHVDCTQLSEEQLRCELATSKSDIEYYLFPKEGVLSFCYPYGKWNAFTNQIASEYYLSCRGPSCNSECAINPDTIVINDLNNIKGFGVYSPVDEERLKNTIQQTIRVHGWILPYFHSITAGEPSASDQVSFEDFLAHLDYVQTLRDSLWLATHSQVAKYIFMRSLITIQSKVTDNHLHVYVQCDGDLKEISDSLSISINVPVNWVNNDMVIVSENTNNNRVVKRVKEMAVIQILPDESLDLYAIESSTK